MNLKEKLFKKKKVYSGRAVNFYADEVILPDGNKAGREYMDHPGAVAVIPFVDENNIILVRQYRYPVNEVTYELPAGKLDGKEDLIKCVKRELAEETGFSAKNVKKLCSYWATPAFSNEVIHIFAAHKLIKSSETPDYDEFIESETISFDKALDWVKKGKIKDSKTVIGLLLWDNKYRKKLKLIKK